MRQVADDAGRQMRRPWLGPKGMRWPMDWEMEEWALAFFVLLAGLVGVVFVVPAGVLVAAITWRVATVVSRRISPEAPQRTFRLFCAAVAGICLMISFDPMTWIRPLWFPFAIIVALLLPIYVVRTQGTFINWNRPFAYWLRLPFIVARGPRLPPPVEVDPSALMLGLDPGSADHATSLEPVVKPTVITSPAKGGKSPLILAPPVRRAPRHRLIERTDQGFRVGGTEYRIEWTF